MGKWVTKTDSVAPDQISIRDIKRKNRQGEFTVFIISVPQGKPEAGFRCIFSLAFTFRMTFDGFGDCLQNAAEILVTVEE